MKTDKELLMLAAKAAGMFGKYYGVEFSDQCAIITPFESREIVAADGLTISKRITWNPLNDDGDAFRLAVDLGIAVRRISNKAMVSSSAGQFNEYCDNDKHAATRRAIVRAAAAIGESMQ